MILLFIQYWIREKWTKQLFIIKLKETVIIVKTAKVEFCNQ
jgi:hypothetical protein